MRLYYVTIKDREGNISGYETPDFRTYLAERGPNEPPEILKIVRLDPVTRSEIDMYPL
jgi:hypothetical protein